MEDFYLNFYESLIFMETEGTKGVLFGKHGFKCLL